LDGQTVREMAELRAGSGVVDGQAPVGGEEKPAGRDPGRGAGTRGARVQAQAVGHWTEVRHGSAVQACPAEVARAAVDGLVDDRDAVGCRDEDGRPTVGYDELSFAAA
jgi:hypothetical protein